MNRKLTWPLLLVVFSLVVAACGGGGGGRSPDTSPPLQVEVTASRTTVEVSQSVELTAEPSGTGGSSAGVAWQAKKGSFDVSDSTFSRTSGRNVTWTAPDETGLYTITATATSGSSQVSDDVTINVVPVGDGDTYHLEGMVWSQGESPVEGVEIAFDGGYESVSSDADGRWYKDGLRGEVTVTVQESDTFKPDDEFYPTSRTVNDYEWIDFYGEVLILVDPYDVSGTVKLSDGSPLEGVRIDIHRHEEAVVTDADGEFTATDIGLHTTLTPVKEGYVIRPETYSVTGEEHRIEFEALTESEAVIEFADPNLEAAVRDALRLDEGAPITVAHVPQVSSVTAWNLSISDLGGIEHFVYLDTFYLGYADNSGLTDLSPLAGLDNLRMVVIRNSSVSDISPLRNKGRMSELYLERNDISDISAVTTMPNLNRLELEGNPLSDITPLVNLQQTHIFDFSIGLQNTLITDVQPISKIRNLGNLYLNDNEYLSDIRHLGETNGGYYELRNTPALDWCDYGATWYVVEDLQRRGATVHTNTPCSGPYDLFGTIEMDSADYIPGTEVHVFASSTEGEWSAEAEWRNTDELTFQLEGVQGRVTVKPRVKHSSPSSNLWRFSPGQQVVASRPREDVDFTMARISDRHIIEGFVEDAFGEGIAGVKITLADNSTEQILQTVTTDEHGYFEHEFDELQWLDVHAEKSGWVFGSLLGVNTPRRVHITGVETGGTIAFVDNGAIYTVNPDGSGRQKVTDVANWESTSLDWSPDGDRIVYVDGFANERVLRVVDVDGSNRTTLFTDSNFDLQGASWSVDGDIVYSRRRTDGNQSSLNPWHLYVTTDAGGEGTELLIDADRHHMDPHWSPAGQQLVAVRRATGTNPGPGIIVWLNADGTTEREGPEGRFPAWSPDGSWTAFADPDGDISEVVSVSANLPASIVDEGTGPSWSPDSDFIAFERDGNIYIVSHDGRIGPAFVTKGKHPVWSP